MVREVQLENYLPEFMQDYREPAAALKAENPEFNLMWKAADKIMHNRFILTADEDGISQFEKMLNIYPTADDTLETRRFRVRNRWFNTLPHTMKALVKKLEMLCSDTDFTMEHDFGYGYTLTLNTNLEGYGKVDELEQIIDSMIPCNIVVKSWNCIKANEPELVNFIGGMTTGSIMVESANYTEQAVINDRVLNLIIPDNCMEVEGDTALNLYALPDHKEMHDDAVFNILMTDNCMDTELELGDDVYAVPAED